MPSALQLAASSRSADGKTSEGDLPPSSSVTCVSEGFSQLVFYRAPHATKRTFLRFDLAAASMILLPVATEPVNATLSIRGWLAIAAPAVVPSPGTTLTTPAG